MQRVFFLSHSYFQEAKKSQNYPEKTFDLHKMNSEQCILSLPTMNQTITPLLNPKWIHFDSICSVLRRTYALWILNRTAAAATAASAAVATKTTTSTSMSIACQPLTMSHPILVNFRKITFFFISFYYKFFSLIFLSSKIFSLAYMKTAECRKLRRKI